MGSFRGKLQKNKYNWTMLKWCGISKLILHYLNEYLKPATDINKSRSYLSASFPL